MAAKQVKVIPTVMIPLSDIDGNDGQIPDVPRNPRFIRDDKFEALKKSIHDDPEMLGLRELMVYPYGGRYIAIGGNMRLRAMSELGYTEAPCKVIPAATTADKLRAYVMKDNYAYGETDFDILFSEWDLDELEDWGMDDLTMDMDDSDDDHEAPVTSDEKKPEYNENPYTQNTSTPIYEIQGEQPTLDELVDTSRTNDIIARIDESSVPDDIKAMLRICAHRHTRIDFGRMAEYYAHASREVQELMEDNALVIIDFNSAIERGFAVMRKQIMEIYDKNQRIAAERAADENDDEDEE